LSWCCSTGPAAILVAAGLTIGVAGAIFTPRFIGGLLFGVDAENAILLRSAVSAIVAAALLATYLPARGAASINPVLALRSQ